MMDAVRGKAMSRAKNKEWLKGKKADIWMGGLKRAFDDDIVIKCEECGKDTYFTDKIVDVKDLLNKKFKRLCPKCVIDKYPESLNEEQRVFLKEAYGI